MASDATIAKQANTLITQYVKIYTEVYDKAPQLNRYREKWGFQDMINDLGFARAQEVINFYFTTDRTDHPYLYLLRNYDKLDQLEIDIKNDAEERARLLRETQKRVREWEKNNGNA